MYNVSGSVELYRYKGCNLSDYWSIYIQDMAIHVCRIIYSDSHGLQDSSYTRASTPLGFDTLPFQGISELSADTGRVGGSFVSVHREEEPYSRGIWLISRCSRLRFFGLRSEFAIRLDFTLYFDTRFSLAHQHAINAGSQLIIFRQDSAGGLKKRWRVFSRGNVRAMELYGGVPLRVAWGLQCKWDRDERSP